MAEEAIAPWTIGVIARLQDAATKPAKRDSRTSGDGIRRRIEREPACVFHGKLIKDLDLGRQLGLSTPANIRVTIRALDHRGLLGSLAKRTERVLVGVATREVWHWILTPEQVATIRAQRRPLSRAGTRSISSTACERNVSASAGLATRRSRSDSSERRLRRAWSFSERGRDRRRTRPGSSTGSASSATTPSGFDRRRSWSRAPSGAQIGYPRGRGGSGGQGRCRASARS
jgi:hypothetical protein